jgi:hypothetical protein
MATAEELVSQAKAATTEAELADIEAQAEGRVTVLNAVNARRSELSSGSQPVTESTSSEQPITPETTSGNAPSGGSATEMEEVESSTTPAAEMPDALGELPEPEVNRTQAIIDAEKEPETGIGGQALPVVGEVAGGNIEKLLKAPAAEGLAQRPLVKEQAALMSPIGQKVAGMLARPVTEWGVIGPGDRIKGHMILLDLNSGQKVRAMDGHIVNAGELYMNLRNAPEALSTGDTIDRVLGG